MDDRMWQFSANLMASMAPRMALKQKTSSFLIIVILSVLSEFLELLYCHPIIQFGYIINFLFSNNDANVGKQWTTRRQAGNGTIFIIIYISLYWENVPDVFRIMMVWR